MGGDLANARGVFANVGGVADCAFLLSMVRLLVRSCYC